MNIVYLCNLFLNVKMGYFRNKEFKNIKKSEINKEYKIKIRKNKIKL